MYGKNPVNVNKKPDGSNLKKARPTKKTVGLDDRKTKEIAQRLRRQHLPKGRFGVSRRYYFSTLSTL